MLKLVLFDADGVLLNGEMFSVHLEREKGIPRSALTPFFQGSFKECILGTADLKTAIGPYLKEWGWADGVNAFLDFWFKAEHAIDEPLVEYVQALRKRGISCCVATNQEKYRAEYMLKTMGFDRSFDKVYASAHLGHKKPSQEFFQAIANEHPNIANDEILFWDDTPENVEAAKAFGFHGEVYSSFDAFQETMKKYF